MPVRPHSRDRRFGTRGVPTRILLILTAAFVLIEILMVITTLAGPPHEGRKRLSELAHTIGVGDAWSFLGVFAAFVVAIQVAAWGNQQAGDRLAQMRSSRFTVAAILTGSIIAASWVLFTIAFNTEATGQYLLLTAASGGIVFFAADGASIVLRQDRRKLLRAETRQTIRATCAVFRREFIGMTYPVAALTLCVTSFAGWCVLFSAGALTALAAAPVWGKEQVTFGLLTAAYSVMASVLVFIVASALACVACWLVWLSRRGTGPQHRLLNRDIGWLAAAAALTLIVLVSCVYFFVAFMLDGAPWWAAASLFLIFALPAAIPFTALMAPEHPSPRKHWWTPRGSVRVGMAAVLRSYVASHMRDVRELTLVFDDAEG
jgi:hypothetical protein